MTTELPVLQGAHVLLEPLEHRHVDGLVAAAAADPSLYRWSPVPQGKAEATKYRNRFGLERRWNCGAVRDCPGSG